MKKSHYFKVWAHCLRQLSQKLFALFQGSTILGSTNQGITVFVSFLFSYQIEWGLQNCEQTGDHMGSS